MEGLSSSKQVWSATMSFFGKEFNTAPIKHCKLWPATAFLWLFFREIKSLRDEMDASYCDPPSLYEYGGPVLSELKRVTNDETLKII